LEPQPSAAFAARAIANVAERVRLTWVKPTPGDVKTGTECGP
jgi:hypothetical protein